jgi:hypothetical protein
MEEQQDDPGKRHPNQKDDLPAAEWPTLHRFNPSP